MGSCVNQPRQPRLQASTVNGRIRRVRCPQVLGILLDVLLEDGNVRVAQQTLQCKQVYSIRPPSARSAAPSIFSGSLGALTLLMELRQPSGAHSRSYQSRKVLTLR